MEEQSFREFISGLSDREAIKLSGACQTREAPKFSAKRKCPGNAGLASYIANDESPSQHVTVGLAEARPKKDMEKI